MITVYVQSIWLAISGSVSALLALLQELLARHGLPESTQFHCSSCSWGYRTATPSNNSIY